MLQAADKKASTEHLYLMKMALAECSVHKEAHQDIGANDTPWDGRKDSFEIVTADDRSPHLPLVASRLPSTRKKKMVHMMMMIEPHNMTRRQYRIRA